MKKSSETINECFERFKTEDPECVKCSLHGEKCNTMIPILINKVCGKNSKGELVDDSIEGFSFEDKKDFIAEVILAIRTGIAKGLRKGETSEEDGEKFGKYLKNTICFLRINVFRTKEKARKNISCLKYLSNKNSGDTVAQNGPNWKNSRKTARLAEVISRTDIFEMIDRLAVILEEEGVCLDDDEKELLEVWFNGRRHFINTVEIKRKPRAELAKIMGITVAAYHKRLNRLKMKIQDALKNTSFRSNVMKD